MNEKNEPIKQIPELTGKQIKPESQNLFDQLQKRPVAPADKTEPEITSLPDECGDTLWDEVLK